MDMFGYILFSFLDSCPDFIPFRQNTPCVGSRRGTAQGAALLTKWEETAIIKAERALLLVVSFAVLHHIIMNNADRLAGTQAVSTLLWKVPVLKTPRTAEISKKICPFQLHPLPTWILRGASQPLFVTTLLSGPFDRAFLS